MEKTLADLDKQATANQKRAGRKSITNHAFSKKLGEIIKEAREMKGMRQADLATKLNLAEVVYGRYERGNAMLTVERLLEICKIVGTNPSEILFKLEPTLWHPDIDTANNIHEIQDRIGNMSSEQLEALLSLTVAFKS